MQARPSSSHEPTWRLLLQQLVDRCVAELVAEHAAVAIATGARHWTPGPASSPAAAALDEQSFTLGEGPVFDAMRAHAPVVVSDLTSADAHARWPAWVPVAAEAGICSTTALPIEAGAITAGVLSLHATVPARLTGHDLSRAREFVDAGLLVLLNMAVSLESGGSVDDGNGATVDGDALSVLLRADVHRAAGMIMVQAGLPIDQALTRLRAHAFATGRPLPAVAADVLSHRLMFDLNRDSAE
jgi:GAF domain-containing protein